MSSMLSCTYCQVNDFSVQTISVQVRRPDLQEVVVCYPICSTCVNGPMLFHCMMCRLCVCRENLPPMVCDDIFDMCMTCRLWLKCVSCEGSEPEVTLRQLPCEFSSDEDVVVISDRSLCTSCGRHDGRYVSCAMLDCDTMVPNPYPGQGRNVGTRPLNPLCSACEEAGRYPECERCGSFREAIRHYHVPDEHEMDGSSDSIPPEHMHVLCDTCAYDDELYLRCRNSKCDRLRDIEERGNGVKAVAEEEDELCHFCRTHCMCTICMYAYSPKSADGQWSALEVMVSSYHGDRQICSKCSIQVHNKA
jgi:hypothetical protein